MTRTKFGHGTFMVQSFPWGFYRYAAGLCADGVVRTSTRMSSTPDTFFSIPGAVKVRGKTVSGYFTHGDLDGTTTVMFVAYRYGKNADVLPDIPVSEYPTPSTSLRVRNIPPRL